MLVKIQDKSLGDNQPVFIIAELSSNHLQQFDLAVKTIVAAKDAGADAIKLQTYTADTITLNCDKPQFQIKHGTVWDGRTLYDLYQEAYTPWEWFPKLQLIAQDLGLVFFASPFDFGAVDFLEKLDIPAYKIASFEINDIPLIQYIARLNKPIIISTGVATEEEIEEAVAVCRQEGNNQIILLKCVSAYPADFAEMNLNSMLWIKDKFQCLTGLSDHSLGIEIPIAAIALGAKIIEKHLILDRNLGGPDCGFSLEPDKFKDMVKGVRNIERALGSKKHLLNEKVLKNRKFMRSLFVTEDICAGEILDTTNIRSIRPSDGLHPRYFSKVMGAKAKINLKKGTPLKMDDLTFF